MDVRRKELRIEQEKLELKEIIVEKLSLVKGGEA